MTFNILTLFPEMLRCFLSESILKRAFERGVASVHIIDVREHSTDKHKKVDDYPFGGGRGMVMAPDPLFRALESLSERGKVVFLSPMGKLLKQEMVRELSRGSALTLICGHYEGVDHRVVGRFVDETISIGDYVLTGGEIPAAVIIDSVTRELDCALGNSESRLEESFDETGLLEYEQYTRPANYRGYEVPAVLLSGNHAEIEKWRLKRRLFNTMSVRPDIFKDVSLTLEMKTLLDEITEEEK